MINRPYTTRTKEYPVNNGVLIIENIFNGNKFKTDVIREIIDYMVCLDGMSFIQSACRNTADCSSQAKEVEN